MQAPIHRSSTISHASRFVGHALFTHGGSLSLEFDVMSRPISTTLDHRISTHTWLVAFVGLARLHLFTIDRATRAYSEACRGSASRCPFQSAPDYASPEGLG